MDKIIIPETIRLTKPTDDDLNAAVARYVAKLYQSRADWDRLLELHKTTIAMFPPFATSADAVIALLTAHTKDTDSKRGGEGDTWRIYAPAEENDVWTVVPVWMHHDGWIDETSLAGQAKTFPRAACIALLRANGVEVVT